jgi:Flp pilus assembly protein TadB
MRRFESLRASDADRDAVTDRLRDAAGEGRLEPEELEERVHAALRARTYGELGRLVVDLPSDGETVWPGSRSRGALTRFALLGAGLLGAITVAVVVIAMVVLLVLAVATLAVVSWIAFVLFLLAFRRSRRRGASGSVWRREVTGRHVRRARATGFL